MPPHLVHLTVAHDPRDPRIVQKQCRSLNEAGYRVTLIAPSVDAAVNPPVAWSPISGQPSRLRRLVAAYQTAVTLHADAYHMHDPDLLPVGWLLKQRTGAVIVYDMHEDFRTRGPFLGRAIRAVERWAFGWLDHVVLAEQGYAPIVEDASVPHTFIENYHHPSTPASEKPPSKRPTRLLYTGSISRSRGLFHMLDVASSIQRANRPERLTLVGICRPDDERTEAERRIQTDALGPYVERVGWTDYVPQASMIPDLQDADVGLALFEPHPNHMKSLLTKFYEYLYHGIPIIASDFSLWRTFVETHDCGAVVPPGDAEAVFAVLDRWQNNPARYRDLVFHARAASKQFRWRIMGERLVQRYTDWVGPPS